MLDRVSSIPEKKIIGIIEVKLGLLVKAWKPEFQRCLTEVFALLPKLADKTFQTFIGKVHSATTRLSTTPTSVEDFASYLEFMLAGVRD